MALMYNWRGAVMAHQHIIGQSGSGKSTLALQQLITDIKDNNAVVFIDPHGHDTDTLLQFIPTKRRGDVILFDPTQFNIPFNPFLAENIPITAESLAMGVKYAWGFGDTPTARMFGTIYFAIAACMEADTTFIGWYRILTNTEYRDKILERVTDPVVREYWAWIDSLNDRDRNAELGSTLNKVRVLFADPRIRAMCHKDNQLPIPELVQNKILLIRLPQGEMGLEKVRLLGSILLTLIHQSCLQRDPSIPLRIVVDECYNFAPDELCNMLAGIRKFGVSLTLIHHYVDQLPHKLLSSLLANAETYVFRVPVGDARYLPPVSPNDVQPYEQSPYSYITYHGSRAVGRYTTPLPEPTNPASLQAIRSNMRRNFHRSPARELE